MARVATNAPQGRPTKKNAQAIARILEVARTGLPMKFAAQAGNIDADTLAQWSVKDPEFARALSQARLEAVEAKWKRIQKAAEDRVDADGKLLRMGDWRSLAWSLERAYPADFARPEVALNVEMQNNTINHTLVISVEQAEKLQGRSRKVEGEIDGLIATHKAQFGARPDAIPERVVEAQVEVVPETITLPPESERTAGWWRVLQGPGTQPISQEAFLYALKTVVGKLRPGAAANQLEIDFDDETPPLRDLLSTLEELTGPAGWQTLVELGSEP